MKHFLPFFLLLSPFLAPSQTEDQIFVRQKLLMMISIADKDLDYIQTICNNENGLLEKGGQGATYTYTYSSNTKQYNMIVTFQFNQLYCKKIKIEILPSNIEDVEIGKFVMSTLKTKFQIKENSVADPKSKTIIYFLSNGRYAGTLSNYTDTKKLVLTISRKTD
jgi:hypothetical protein